MSLRRKGDPFGVLRTFRVTFEDHRYNVTVEATTAEKAIEKAQARRRSFGGGTRPARAEDVT